MTPASTKPITLLFGALLTLASALSAASFQKAMPHWPDTGGDDLNRRVGFRLALDAPPSDAVLRIATSGLYRATIDGKFLGHGPARAGHGHFRIDEWPLKDLLNDKVSVIGIEVAASEARSYYMVKQAAFLQAEIVSGDKVLATTRDFKAIDLPEGVHEIETFEPYTMRYLQLHALDAAITVEKVYLRELAHPHAERSSFTSSDPRLDAIFEAARQTFRQNATDIFMDCPSRERAGWLCDSFFTGRVEADFTGELKVERNFLENFALPDAFPGLIQGMLPMCYPMDPYQGDHIPNWAMWFVLELEEYLARTGDRALTERLKPRVEALMKYFTRFENSDGLLEKLDGWIFVEWSKANEFVRDVNYPTNMLYAAALDAAGRIYQNESWKSKASAMRETINRQSFDGTYYRDHAIRRPDGTLDIRPDRTEVCQYYAFFCSTTTPEQRPELWKTLVEEFGPSRRETKAHPEIFPCNQLPGNMLRIEILSRYGKTERIHDEALGYWQMMSETTGTLWEHDKPQASCNHGFASHAAVVLRRDVLGLREINHQAKTITFSLPDNPLSHCRGSFPTQDGDIVIEWKRGHPPEIKLPDGWKSVPAATTGQASR